MIKREHILTILASDISDATGADKERAFNASAAVFRSVGLNVIFPILDALEFDARPLYRERVLNEARDLLSSGPDNPVIEVEPESQGISDE
jgi:hypothetical protein